MISITNSIIKLFFILENPTYVYDRETFGRGKLTKQFDKTIYEANSGVFLSGLSEWSDSIRNDGQTPAGLYVIGSVGKGTGGIIRANLIPIGHDAKGRTHLQIHEKSPNRIKAAMDMDSKGCIATDAAKYVKEGETILVK